MKRPRVLLADDHTLVAEGLRKLLEAECELVGVVENGRALVEAARSLRPDVILLDISMPLLNGIEAARQLRRLVPDSKLIFVTMHADPTYAAEAFQAGASGYVLKRSAASELLGAIGAALQGRRHVDSGVPGEASRIPGARPAQRVGRLTARQREVLQLVAEGRSTKEIARILGVSVKTVEFHRSRMMEHLGLHSIADLTRYALTHGYIVP